MSNISRRKFLKGAGVAALAVAAAGVLAGCSGNDVPSIPDVTAKDVTVKFVDRKGKEVGTTVVKNVKLTETKMNSNDVKAPEGYVIGIVGDQRIDWDNQTVTFTVDKKETKKVQVQCTITAEGDGEVGAEIVEVEKDAIGVNTNLLKEIAPRAISWTPLAILQSTTVFATVYVSRK
ncbi:MAG: twin-arginine translocation signal domain-containing protein [Faecalibacterium sp.]